MWQEPNVKLSGLGYLPRFLQPLMVRILRRKEYEMELPSYGNLQKALSSAFPDSSQCALKHLLLFVVDKNSASWRRKIIHRIAPLRKLVNALSVRLHPFDVVIENGITKLEESGWKFRYPN